MLSLGDNERKVVVNGVTRAYRLVVPPHYDDAIPHALVLLFHGGGTNPNWVSRFCGMHEHGEQSGFLVAYPYGTGVKSRRLTWNCGERCGFDRWTQEEGDGSAGRLVVDEIAFVTAMLDDLARLANLDSTRIYASGISTGAIMCYYLANHMADRIAAIAPVGGPTGEATCNPSRPVPIIHFHGTEDQFAPYHGGRGAMSFTGVDFFSVDYTMQSWVRANRCAPVPQVYPLPAVTENETSVSLTHWTADEDGAEIKLYTIHGGGHTWPGRDPRMDLMGRYTKDIDANALIWDFFQQHPLPS